MELLCASVGLDVIVSAFGSEDGRGEFLGESVSVCYLVEKNQRARDRLQDWRWGRIGAEMLEVLFAAGAFQAVVDASEANPGLLADKGTLYRYIVATVVGLGRPASACQALTDRVRDAAPIVTFAEALARKEFAEAVELSAFLPGHRDRIGILHWLAGDGGRAAAETRDPVEAAEMRLGTTVERGDRPGALLALDQLLDALAVERRIGRSLPDHIVQRRRTGTHEGSLALDARVVALDAARAEIRHLLETSQDHAAPRNQNAQDRRAATTAAGWRERGLDYSVDYLAGERWVKRSLAALRRRGGA